MKRRSMLLLSLLAFPGRLFGQDSPRRTRSSTAKGRRVSDGDDEPAKPRRARANPEDVESTAPDGGPESGHGESIPANFPNQAGFEWKSFPISAYTALDPNAASPQTAILDWVFRRTTTAPWHGDKVAVLCASRTQIRAYNSPKILKQVAEVVDQFVEAQADVLSIRVRFLAASDSRWRYSVLPRLTAIGNGPQGQQIWLGSIADTESVINQMQIWQGFKALGDKKVEVLNGQTLRFDNIQKRAFVGSVQRDGAVGLGFQPKVENLDEGVVLRFSPLLGYDGDTLDAAVELSTNLVRKLHQVKVLGPREIGTGEVAIDVPEVSETRLNQPIRNWPLGQALIISTGIQPGILQDKGGFLNLKIPGTVPTGTELLVVINADIAGRKPRDRAS